MSTEEDRALYERRLREERARAVAAIDQKLRDLHLEWASLYEARVASVIATLGAGTLAAGQTEEHGTGS